MAIGIFAKFFGTRPGMAIIMLQLVAVILFVYFSTGYQSSDTCVKCHADTARMTALGYPELAMTREQVQKESHHPNTECRDCHLGNGLSDDPARAHKGMLKLIVLNNDLEIIPRKGHVTKLIPSGNDRLRNMLPRSADGELDYDVGTLMWHDRGTLTLGYDPAIAQKTCGKSACHPEEVKQFGTSVMGANFRQRSLRTWNDIHGPNNCGPSFADTQPAGRAEGDRFSFDNTKKIAAEISLPITHEQAVAKQRACNLCHAGCLDCHYAPSRENGAHTFSRVPPSPNCTNGGRSTFVCHAGTMERRRGDSYLGKDFSEPAGLPEDVHVKLRMECVDCHQTAPEGMGHIQRHATCQDCHIEAEQALAASVHRNLACAACHVRILGGYEMTSWGPGKILSKPNPFKKYSLYYGTQEPPVLIRDRNGRWMPTKIWPNSAGSIKDTVAAKPGLVFRWPKGETHDAYAQLGTFNVPGGNNNYLAWLQVDEVAHPFGKSRTCGSCHDRRTQIARVKWEFFDAQGAEPFTGSQTVVAGREGIHVKDIKATSKITLMEGGRIEYFAAWMPLGDIWKTSGDFSIPRSDPKKYRGLDRGVRETLARIETIDRKLKASEAKGENVKTLRRKWKEARAAAVHDPGSAEILIREIALF